MRAHPTIDQTIAFATEKHSGQSDKNGVPYIAHPLAVMRRVPPKAWHVACLHDVMEDCGVKVEELAAMGYASEELTALVALTHRDNETYEDFIDRVINEGPSSGIRHHRQDRRHRRQPRTVAQHVRLRRGHAAKVEVSGCAAEARCGARQVHGEIAITKDGNVRHLAAVTDDLEGGQAMDDEHLSEERRSGNERRQPSPGDAAVQTFNNAEAGLSKLWRVGTMLVTLLCTTFVLGGQWFAYKEMSAKLALADVSIQKLQGQVQQIDINGQLKERDDKHYREDIEKRQARDEEFRHTIRAYEFAIATRLAEVQGRVGIKQQPLPEIKGDD